MANEKIFASVIFINGKVYTVDKDRSWAEAVAICGNRIIAVGKNEEILNFSNDDTEVIDLKGNMLLPGFIESHAHPISASYMKSGINIEFTMSIDEVLQEVKNYVSKHPEFHAYIGQGFSEWMFDSNGPRKELLDKIVSDKPVMLKGAGGHSAWCNSKALEVAGITRNTPDPVPNSQFFKRDENGIPTGCLVETEPMSMVLDAIDPYIEEEVIKTFKKITNDYSAAGVTAIQEGGALGNEIDEGRELVQSALKEGWLKQRIMACEAVLTKDAVNGAIERLEAAREKYTGDKFAVTHLKIINDGALEARSAAMIEPYTEDGSVINPLLSQQELDEIFIAAAKIKSDICVHGIGDKTIRETLLAAKAIRERGYDDIRVASIHSICIHPDDLDKFAEYSVVANTTPIWHHENKDKERIIGERAHINYLMKSLYKRGVTLTFSSDYPTDELGKEPLKGIEMGITRQLFDHPEDPVLLPLSERLTVDIMIEGYTINGAYMMRKEDKLGSIEVNKYADFVILDENLFEIDPHDIHKVKVLMTVLDGKIVYESGEA